MADSLLALWGVLRRHLPQLPFLSKASMSADLSKLTVEHGDSGFEYGEEKCVGEGGHFWTEDVVCGSVTWYSCERCSVPAWIDHSEASHAP